MDDIPAASDDVAVQLRDESLDLRYLTGGDGPPLVCCHGIGLDAATVSWRHAFDALTDEFTVYVPDLPGHGESDAPRRTYTTSYYVDALEAFLDALGLAGASLVGISMGGAVALGHALDGGDPERLVLVDSYGLGADAYWRRAASAAVRLPFAGNALWGSVASRAGVRANVGGMVGAELPEDLVTDVATAVSPSSMRTLRSWQRHEFGSDGFRTDHSDRLSELSVPTLLVHGARDPLLPVSWSRRANERVENGTLRVFENCGHWPPRERPAAFNRALREFARA